MEKTAWLKPDADLEGEEAGLEPRYATRRFQLEHHLVEPTGTWVCGARLLVTATAQPALLGLPLAVSALGWAGGITVLVLGGCYTLYCNLLLASLHDYGGARQRQYRQLAKNIMGERHLFAFHLIIIPQYTIIIGLGVANLVLASDNLQAICSLYHTDCPLANYQWTIVVAAALMLLAQCPDMGSSGVLTGLSSFFVVFYSTAAIALSAVQGGGRGAEYSLLGSEVNQVMNAFNAVGIIVFTYTVPIIPEIQASCRLLLRLLATLAADRATQSTYPPMRRALLSAFVVIGHSAKRPNMISALAWIPRGAAKAVPEVAEVTEAEIAAMKAAAAEDVEDGAEEGSDTSDEDLEEGEEEEEEEGSQMEGGDGEAAEVAQARAVAAAMKSSQAASSAVSPGGDHLAAAMAELDMDRYDEESDGEGGAIGRILGSSNNPGMAYHRHPGSDPFLGLDRNSDSDTDSEAEAFVLREEDLLILAARNEDDVSHLEVWVYEEADERGPANLYVHHSRMLPAFPLAVAWLDCDPSGKRERANIAAVGSFEPGIELWDMDVVDAVEPLATLGGADYAAARAAAATAAAATEGGEGGGGKKKKGSKKKKKGSTPEVPVKPGSHEDAVLGLAWNPAYRNVLASASADTTVKVWDVATQSCQHTLRHHSDKVQAVAWNPAEAPVLLSGGFDKKACLLDVRIPDSQTVPTWLVSADVEALSWDPHHPTQFVVAAEDGVVAAYDARLGAGSAPLYQLSAHDKPTCALSFCPAVPGLLATSSTDKKVKVWSMLEHRPVLLATQNLNVGAVFSMGFSRDSPLVLAAGGAKGTVSVWDTWSAGGVCAFVQQHAPELAAARGRGAAEQQAAAAAAGEE
ncbi:hypothetical protein D9Q98_006327 [Chlorella vulgaris]|uniref:Amino acid transporter transmembrane domain-containing protein n=1 Tax=Chlorella vulgaris TaxID=3077 RepID=A0A9D4TK07_CHLVU|nr:hypothetical protein D9Q98_006327 [Chlorella vulgaris]